MDDIALPDPSMKRAPAPRLCATVEGVEFWIRLTTGRLLRCVITESALQGHYGAEDERPQSWLGAFAQHRPDIEAGALAASAHRDDVHVVIANDSEGRLRTSVGPCSV